MDDVILLDLLVLLSEKLVPIIHSFSHSMFSSSRSRPRHSPPTRIRCCQGECMMKMVLFQINRSIGLHLSLFAVPFVAPIMLSNAFNYLDSYRYRGAPHAHRCKRPNFSMPLFGQSVQQPRYGDDSELFEMGYPGEGICLPQPSPELSAEDIVHICMDSLAKNDEPRANAGLEVCFDFSSDRCRAALGGSLENFINFASNPIFASMVNAKEWNVVSVGPVIAGSQTRGAMKTVLIDLKPESGRDRRFLWTLQQERRPPRQGCWLVHECIFVENAFAMTE